MRLFGVDVTPAGVCVLATMADSDTEPPVSKDSEEIETEMKVVQESEVLDAVEK